MIRFCEISNTLTSAYIISKDKKYVTHLLTHLKAWFVNEETKMKLWLSKYLQCINTHPFREKEKNNGSKHSTCWALQIAVFTALVNDKNLKNDMILFYKQTLLPFY